MRKTALWAAAVLAAGIAAALAAPAVLPRPAPPAPPLPTNGDAMSSLQPQDLAGAWVVTDLAGAAPLTDNPPTVEFGPGGVSGFAGCNRYNATVGVQDGNLVFGPLAMTKMACGEAAMAVEIAMIRAFQRISAAAVEPDGTLALTGYGQPMIRAKLATAP